MDGQDDEQDETPAEFLRSLAERLKRVPVMYGVDDYDIDRLLSVAREMEAGPSGKEPGP